VREIEGSIFEEAAPQPLEYPRYVQYLCIRAIFLVEMLCWLLIRLEVAFLSNPRVRAAAKRVFRYLRSDRG
jgi:hypothetical protein